MDLQLENFRSDPLSDPNTRYPGTDFDAGMRPKGRLDGEEARRLHGKLLKQLAGLSGEILGVPVAWTALAVREHVARTIVKAGARFGLSVEVPKSIHLLDGYHGAGRGGLPDEHLLGIATLARQEGVMLDPVYTAKSFFGLVDALRRDPKAFGQRICFIHTGGIFSLFPFQESLTRLLDVRDGLSA